MQTENSLSRRRRQAVIFSEKATEAKEESFQINDTTTAVFLVSALPAAFFSLPSVRPCNERVAGSHI
jgi:hypothetical protein